MPRTKLAALLLIAPLVLTGCATTPIVVQPSHTGRDVAIVVAVTGGIATVTYLAIHSHHVFKGCTSAEASGLAIKDGDGQTFSLVGATTAIKPGEVVKVKGRKGKKDKAGHRNFMVDEVAKDYGPCKVAPTAS